MHLKSDDHVELYYFLRHQHTNESKSFRPAGQTHELACELGTKESAAGICDQVQRKGRKQNSPSAI